MLSGTDITPMSQVHASAVLSVVVNEVGWPPVSIPNFVKIDQLIKMLKGTHGDHINFLFFSYRMEVNPQKCEKFKREFY